MGGAKSSRADLATGLALDAIGVLGGALVAYGAWLVYRPAGFIVAGLLLLFGVLLIVRD